MTGTLVREAPLTMRFALEPYSERLVQEMWPLWDEHNREIPQLGLPIDPDLQVYAQSARSGAMRIYTARVGSGWESTLVGYQVFFVMKHPHRKYNLEASQDMIWLDPEVRKGMVGAKFIRWADGALRDEGIKAIHRQISAQKDFGHLLERSGYVLMDLTYARIVEA